MKSKITIIILIFIAFGFINYASAGTYTVKEGDTLSKISTKFYGKSGYWPELQRYNDISNANLIYPGAVLTIPGSDVMQAMSQASTLSEKQSVASQAKSNGGSMPSSNSNTDNSSNNNSSNNNSNSSNTSTTGTTLPPVTPTESNPQGVHHDPFTGMDVDDAVSISQ